MGGKREKETNLDNTSHKRREVVRIKKPKKERGGTNQRNIARLQTLSSREVKGGKKTLKSNRVLN